MPLNTTVVVKKERGSWQPEPEPEPEPEFEPEPERELNP
eukprot:COSAG04_NODE_32207_length_252_cov_0.928105_1_plen_38_part_01